METINGISFEDWAAASANIANGMSGEEVYKILGIEAPVWEDTNKKWGEKMADLDSGDPEMKNARKFAEIFQNPKVGKFANAGNTASMGDTLKLVPDFDTFTKISVHQSKAAEVGLDPGEVIANYGLSLQQWGQVAMHYSNWVKEKIHEENATPEEREIFNTSDQKWEAHFEEMYKDKKVDLGDDINFDDDGDVNNDDVDPDWVPNDEDDWDF